MHQQAPLVPPNALQFVPERSVAAACRIGSFDDSPSRRVPIPASDDHLFGEPRQHVLSRRQEDIQKTQLQVFWRIGIQKTRCFRDYFLSFVLPTDDDLFDDEDLDSCQIYDFVKDAEKREREDAERKQEEERRRRIDDDEDYEEELTTIVNDMEEDGDGVTQAMPVMVTPSESPKFSTLGTSEPVKKEVC